jgi:signal transduction histidine kinase
MYVIETREPVSDEISYTDTKSETRYYEYIFNPVFKQEGEVEKVIGSMHDVTERKWREERDQFLLKLSDQIHGLKSQEEITEACTQLLA